MSERLGITWHGTDGSTWDLRSGPVRTTVAGIRGMAMPTVQYLTQETALLDGQRTYGYKLKPRDVFLPLRFHSLDVTGVQRAFWRSVEPGKFGVLSVDDGAGDLDGDRTGHTRYITLKFKDDGGLIFALDPSLVHAPIGLTMTADDPWWYGPDHLVLFGDRGADDNFFGGRTGYGPPFIITSANTSGEESVSNPGDVDAWPVWLFEGVSTGFDTEVSGYPVSGTISVADGQLLTVDTDPLVQTAMLTGEGLPSVEDDGNRTDQLVDVEFERVPSGTAVPIKVTSNGPGNTSMRLRPRYFRAF
jgi:hypothetical protein